jgi:hypothetical protein
MTVFWVLAPCRLVKVTEVWEVLPASITRIWWPDYTTQQPRSQLPSYSLLCEPEISQDGTFSVIYSSDQESWLALTITEMRGGKNLQWVILFRAGHPLCTVPRNNTSMTILLQILLTNINAKYCPSLKFQQKNWRPGGIQRVFAFHVCKPQDCYVFHPLFFPIWYLKVWMIKYTQLLFFLLFSMIVKIGLSH